MACEDVAPPERPSIFGSCPTATMDVPSSSCISSQASPDPKAGLAFLLALTFASGASAQPAAPPLTPDRTLIEETVERAAALPNLRSLIVSHDGNGAGGTGAPGRAARPADEHQVGLQDDHVGARRHRHRARRPAGHRAAHRIDPGAEHSVRCRCADPAGHHRPSPVHAGRIGAHLGPQLRRLDRQRQLGPLRALASLRRRARRAHALFHRQHASPLGGTDARREAQHPGACPRLARRAARDHDRAVDTRSAGHLSRRQRDGALAPRASSLRRDVPARRHSSTASAWCRRTGFGNPGRRARPRPSPATDTAMAGSCARCTDTWPITPGASAGRCST